MFVINTVFTKFHNNAGPNQRLQFVIYTSLTMDKLTYIYNFKLQNYLHKIKIDNLLILLFGFYTKQT